MSGQSIRSRAPKASSPAVRRVMQAVQSRDTAPEIALRRFLHALGLRFRKDFRPEQSVRCKADIVFPREKLCIFVDGCFWHRCALHFQLPKSNSGWWQEKIQATVDRDLKQVQILEARGWTVVRVWEHDLEPNVITALAERIAGTLREFGRGRR